MLMRELYCVVCGATFTEPDIIDPDDVKEDEASFAEHSYDRRFLSADEVQWLEDFRLFGLTQEPENRFLNISTDDEVSISSPVIWNYHDKAFPKVQSGGEEGGQVITREMLPYAFWSSRRDSALFSVHDICLGLLHLFVEAADTGKTVSITSPPTIASFAHAYAARLHYCKQRSGNVFHASRQTSPWYFEQGGLEWEHGYYGARAYWADPWDAEPNTEWLVANLSQKQNESIDEFLSSCLQHSARERSIWTQLDLTDQMDVTADLLQNRELELISLPYDILVLIASHLPLRSLLNLHAANRKLHARIPAIDGGFWRQQTMRLHSEWCIELKELDPSAQRNWKVLLQALTLGRLKVLASAADLCELDGDRDGWRRKIEDTSEMIDEKRRQYGDLPRLPAGLMNRLHIWCIIEAVIVGGFRRLNAIEPEMHEVPYTCQISTGCATRLSECVDVGGILFHSSLPFPIGLF